MFYSIWSGDMFYTCKEFIFTVYFNINQFQREYLIFFIISWTRRTNNALYNVVYMKLRNMNESFIIVQKHSKKVYFRKMKIKFCP